MVFDLSIDWKYKGHKYLLKTEKEKMICTCLSFAVIIFMKQY